MWHKIVWKDKEDKERTIYNTASLDDLLWAVKSIKPADSATKYLLWDAAKHIISTAVFLSDSNISSYYYYLCCIILAAKEDIIKVEATEIMNKLSVEDVSDYTKCQLGFYTHIYWIITHWVDEKLYYIAWNFLKYIEMSCSELAFLIKFAPAVEIKLEAWDLYKEAYYRLYNWFSDAYKDRSLWSLKWGTDYILSTCKDAEIIKAIQEFRIVQGVIDESCS